MSTELTATQVNLDDRTRRMARMGAARAGVSLSGYVATLVRADAARSGIAGLLADAEADASAGESEVQDG